MPINSRFWRFSLLVCCLVGCSRVAAAQHRKPIAIAVLDAKDANGFVEPKTIDSLRDIEHELKGCKALRVVGAVKDAPARAIDDIPRMNISVSRTVEKTDGIAPIYYEALHAFVGVIPEWPELGAEVNVAPFFKLIYKVGGYGRWRYAAKEVVTELCEWTEANWARLSR